VAIGAFPRSMDMLLSAVLTQSKQWEAGVEFACGHCGGRSLWFVAVKQEHVTVECLTCGKQSTIDRAGAPRPANPPPQS
jgi:transcription elongation factor Elf1